jgi:hypothetical protein
MPASTRKTLGDRVVKLLGYSPYVFVLLYIWLTLFFHPVFIVPLVMYWRIAFKGTLNLVQGIGPVYWIVRDDTRMLSAGRGTMHELAEPWRKGRGLYIVVARYCLQVGLCRTQTFSETEGILSAMQGRFLELEPREIGNWNGIQKETDSFKATA